MILAYSRGDGAAANYEIAGVTVGCSACGRGRFLSRGIDPVH